MTAIYSGDEIQLQFINTANNNEYFTYYQGGGPGGNNYGFTNTQSGNYYTTFVILKINPLSTTTEDIYIDSNGRTNPDAIINLGNPFVLIQKPEANPGLVVSAWGTNNIELNTKENVISLSNGCGVDGGFFAMWVFTSADGNCTGKLVGQVGYNDGSLQYTSTAIVAEYGDPLIIQSYGQYDCATLLSGGLINQPNAFWYASTGATAGTVPNLNLNTIQFASCPGGNTDQFTFQVLTPSGDTTTVVNSCIPNCTTGNCSSNCCTYPTCGATTWSFGSWASGIWDDIINFLGNFIWIILIVILAIFIIGVVVVVLYFLSKNSKKPEKSEGSGNELATELALLQAAKE